MMKPPFRADQVGSLLRPEALLRAREKYKRGEITGPALREAEDTAIRELVARQEAIGLQGITDGESRRDYWHLDFMQRLDGVKLSVNPGPKFGGTEEQPPIATVVGKVKCSRPIMADDFAFLKSATKRTAKMTIPAPATLHLRGGRKAISREAYPDLDEFWCDAAAAYRDAIGHFIGAGCTYLQLDDVGFAYLADEKFRASCRSNGDDPDSLPRAYSDVLNAAIAGRPPSLAVTMHTCHGNFRSAWATEGGYDRVAEALFSCDVDGFFMEFDTERSGGFEPLRHVPKAKKIVLGLVSTKLDTVETADTIKRRIDEAAKFVPLEDLCLSPQCGFSSTYHGNKLSMDNQWRKLELVVSVANDVWGGVA